jgi:site-specific recombinase XerD
MTTLKEYLQGHYSPTAIGNYYGMIKRFTAYMNNKQDKADYKYILEYIGYLRKSRLGPRSVHNHLHVIKVYYNWLNDTGQRKDHPCKRLNLKDNINRSIALESLYTPEALENLLQSHKSKYAILQKRDECVISLLIYQALTTHELSALELNDLDLEKGTIHVKGSYSNKARRLSLKSGQIMLFYQYINQDRPRLLSKNKQPRENEINKLILSYTGHRILPTNITDILNPRRQNKTDMLSLSKHKLLPIKIRQSVIMHLLKQGHDLRVVQVFAGHRKASSTEQYKQTGLEELKTAVQKHHPLGYIGW